MEFRIARTRRSQSEGDRALAPSPVDDMNELHLRVVHETGGIYDAAHGGRLGVATDRRASFQFAGERILAFEGAPLPDVGQAALD